MATTGYTRRRINLFTISSTTADAAGPYEQVFESLKEKAPFETKGSFGRKIRINFVDKIDDVWLVELYLILDRLEILEVSADPDENDDPAFVIPAEEKSFATRACGIFELNSKISAIEYVRSGPKMIDFMEVLSEECVKITQSHNAQIALSPIIEENFLKEINNFERIRQVKVIFNRPNPGWGDISILCDELDGSGDVKREVVLTAARNGSIQKNQGILQHLKSLIRSGRSPVSNVVVTGKRPGDAGETQVSSEKSEVKHVASMPITDQEAIYRRRFINVAIPFIKISDRT